MIEPIERPQSGARLARLFSFPNPVNEVSARLVAAGVVVMSVATLVFDQPILLAVMAYGFLARVLTGPSLEFAPEGSRSSGLRAPSRSAVRRLIFLPIASDDNFLLRPARYFQCHPERVTVNFSAAGDGNRREPLARR